MPVYKCIKNFDKREKGYKRIKIRYDSKIKMHLPHYLSKNAELPV